MFHPPPGQDLSLGDHAGWVGALKSSVASMFVCSIRRLHPSLFCSCPRMLVLQSRAAQWDVGIFSLFGAFHVELAETGENILSFYQMVGVETFSLSLQSLHSYHGFVV